MHPLQDPVITPEGLCPSIPCTTIASMLLSLCMQDPVITPEGYIFSKEAILENLLAQVRSGGLASE